MLQKISGDVFNTFENVAEDFREFFLANFENLKKCLNTFQNLTIIFLYLCIAKIYRGFSTTGTENCVGLNGSPYFVEFSMRHHGP